MDPRLPTVPVPLLPGETELRLDLAPLVNAIYVGSKYGLSINYALPLSPRPKNRDDVAWLEELLRSAGRRA